MPELAESATWKGPALAEMPALRIAEDRGLVERAGSQKIEYDGNNDEIVEEIHTWRAKYAQQFDYDLNRMFADLQQKESLKPAPRTTLQPLEPCPRTEL